MLLPVGGLYCSPDQTTLLHIGLVSGRATLMLRNLETNEVEALTGVEIRSDSPAWLPDSLPVVPVRVVAEKDTLWMEWGGNADPEADVVYSDGSSSKEGLWWEALDPEIVSLNPEGLLVGNQAGVARVLARWRHSLKDTVVVVVEDTGQGGPAALYRGDWSLPLDQAWIPFGLYPPTVEDLGDGPVLRLWGAEKYNDGLLYRDSLEIDQGITVELEFQMELTGVLHQNLRLCLHDYDFTRLDLELGVFLGQGDSLCLGYPAREMAKLDRSELSLMVSPGVETRARVPESLPTSGWTHVAIQVRADGECSLVVNRERVATCPIHLRTDALHRWTVKLSGDAVGTEVYVRNLNIWRNVRY